MSGFRGPRGEGRYGVILGAHCPAPSRAQPNIAAHHTTVQAACRQAGWSRHHLGFGLGRRALLRRLATHAIGQLQHLPAGHSRMVGPHTAGHDLLVQLGAGWCREQLCPSAKQTGRQSAQPCHATHSAPSRPSASAAAAAAGPLLRLTIVKRVPSSCRQSRQAKQAGSGSMGSRDRCSHVAGQAMRRTGSAAAPEEQTTGAAPAAAPGAAAVPNTAARPAGHIGNPPDRPPSHAPGAPAARCSQWERPPSCLHPAPPTFAARCWPPRPPPLARICPGALQKKGRAGQSQTGGAGMISASWHFPAASCASSRPEGPTPHAHSAHRGRCWRLWRGPQPPAPAS